MTLTVVLAVEEGMVFASDSRGTIGDPRLLTAQNDTIQKQYVLMKHTVLQMSGANETGAMVIEEIENWCKNQKTCTTTNIMQEARKILIKRFDEWFPNIPPQPIQGKATLSRPVLNVTIGGYDLEEKKLPFQRIYLLPSSMNFPPQLFNTNMCMTGIPQYATYLMHRLYSRTMSLVSATQLAAYVITETATQDGKVGGPLQIIQMTVEEGAKKLNIEEITSITHSNTEVSNKLKGLFT